MPQTDPVETEFTADASGITAGTEEAKRALRGYGDEVDTVGRKQFRLVRESTNLLSTVLAVRGAFSITSRILEDFGIKNDAVSRSLQYLEGGINIAIAALSIYRAATGAAALVDAIHTKILALKGTMLGGATIPIVGFAIAAAAAVAAWTLISSLTPPTPRAQYGGIVPARPGGTMIVAGEAGEAEAIVPLSRAGDYGFGRGGGITVNGPLIGSVQTNDPDYIIRRLGRRIEQLKTSGA